MLVSGGRAPEAAERIEHLWQMCLAQEDTSRADATVRVSLRDRGPSASAHLGAGRVEGSSLPDVLQLLTQAVTRAAIDSRAGQLVMLHAAGLADPTTGAAIALVAPGGTGKTTAVRVLGPGRAYLTDETVAVQEDNTVLSYPKPVSLRREPGSRRKEETEPSTLGLLPPPSAARLSAVVMLDRRDDHGDSPVVEQVATLDAIALLTPESSHLPELDRPLQRMARLCDSVGGVLRVTYRDAEHLGPLVDSCLGRSA